MHERIGIFVNRYSRPEAIRQACELGQQTGNAVTELNGSVYLGEEETVIVAGGDGSVRSVMQEMVAEGKQIPLVVVPGGSENGLWHALVDAHATVTLNDLVCGKAPEFPLFHPGAINEVLFHHATGWDPFVVNEAAFNDASRFIFPRKLRGYAGGALALLVSRIPEERRGGFTIRLVTTGRFVGSVKIPMLQDLSLHSGYIGVLTICADNLPSAKAKVGLLAAYMVLGLTPPEKIVLANKQLSLFTENYCGAQSVNADGEVVPLAPHGTIYIRKTPEAVPVAAFVNGLAEEKLDYPLQTKTTGPLYHRLSWS